MLISHPVAAALMAKMKIAVEDRPRVKVEAILESIDSEARFEVLMRRLPTVETWNDLLAEP